MTDAWAGDLARIARNDDHPLAGVILDAAESAFEWAREHERAPPGHYKPAGALFEIGRYLTLALDYHVQQPSDAPAVRFAWMPEGAFEAWLITRYLRWVRSEAFEASAEREYLLAEWECSR